ncbi:MULTISPECIES: restriction endonuclease subunit S [unclassified Microcoleus]|uniref:restriction endonuclease subunit S n=1 Tax=unclassified Microcoleus TaxID=2642155 RepID=UPI002FD11CBA
MNNYKLSIKKYPLYKNSEVEWLGDVPEHWTIQRIKNLSFLQSGNNITSEQIEEEGEYPVYGGNGLRGYFSRNTNEGCHILIGRQGALCGNINYAFGKFWATEHAVVVYLRQSINVKWYGEILRVMNLNQYSLSSAQPGLSVDRIKRLLLPVPPFPEQETIANYLDTQTAQLDRKIDLLTQKATLYRNLKQSLINETVTRGLDKTVPMKDSAIEWLGEVPEHWKITFLVKTLSSLVDYRGRTPRKVNNDENGMLLVTARNIKKGRIDYSLSEEFVDVDDVQSLLNRGKPEIGDVLFTTEAPLGEVANVDRLDFALAQRIIKFRGKNNTLDNYFMKYWLMSSVFQDSLQRNATGSTALGLKGSKVRLLSIVLPPISEQKAIADYLDTKTAQIEQIIQTINTQIEKLKELRKTLINDVVTGKIKVV